jgi:Na+-transporting methylmalonyl-CoA/oxaloacetate decarboxylase beta subunit
MEENYKFKEFTLEELQEKHKKLQRTVTRISIVMIIAQIVLLFIAVKDEKYPLLLIVVLGAMLPAILPIITPLKKLETEIKSRNSQS